MLKLIDTNEKLSKIQEENPIFFLLKHSLTCPISESAKREFEAFCEESSYPCFILHVQESRKLSLSIADTYQVKHESPQVLLFKDNSVVWHDSHWKITQTSLKEEASQL
ncbi:bacillithiol system redox-active protein YtxJ [Halobacillus sp. Marseille-Q1614]|uniref:bacillithiol system redox-active protein YtxJ n=1 Tax=Halobacillus sp. Marseille-Q1614 TaxID=2709134 RepID=UPI00353046FC